MTGSRGKIVAPWTPEQVMSLNDFQSSGVFHPFTGNNSLAPEGEDDILVATPEGWISTRDSEYRQNWAWAWMADRTWEGWRVSLPHLPSDQVGP